jgi:glycosyltransferase involved in cell wall biosynthesis
MRVSLCMIVKNEEANLPDCLQSAADLVQEIVVVDTGSTDRTKEIAARFGARLFDFAWCDDFAAARNETLRHAAGDWIFWLDADDRLDAENRQRLRNLFAALRDENVVYLMTCRSPEGRTATLADLPRLFRNRPDIRWKYRIHEQIVPCILGLGGSARKTDVVIHHLGYQDEALFRRKLDRNRSLLERSVAEDPDDSWMLLNLGQTYLGLGRASEALPLLRRCLERSKPGEKFVRKLYGQLARCYHQFRLRNEALATCRAGLLHYPDYAELLFLQSQLLTELGDLVGAEACLVRLLQPGGGFVSGDEGLFGYKARMNLGLVYQRQGRLSETEAQWRAVVAEQPDFPPGWLALADLWLSQGRQAELEQAVRRQPTTAAGNGLLLQARLLIARRDFASARALLQSALDADPGSPWPRKLLADILRLEGRS